MLKPNSWYIQRGDPALVALIMQMRPSRVIALYKAAKQPGALPFFRDPRAMQVFRACLEYRLLIGPCSVAQQDYIGDGP
jgi:hypothetical protein